MTRQLEEEKAALLERKRQEQAERRRKQEELDRILADNRRKARPPGLQWFLRNLRCRFRAGRAAAQAGGAGTHPGRQPAQGAPARAAVVLEKPKV